MSPYFPTPVDIFGRWFQLIKYRRDLCKEESLCHPNPYYL